MYLKRQFNKVGQSTSKVNVQSAVKGEIPEVHHMSVQQRNNEALFFRFNCMSI